MHDTKHCRLNKRAKYDSKHESGGPSTKELNTLVKAHIAKAISKAAKNKKKKQYHFEKFRKQLVRDDSSDKDAKPAENHNDTTDTIGSIGG